MGHWSYYLILPSGDKEQGYQLYSTYGSTGRSWEMPEDELFKRCHRLNSSGAAWQDIYRVPGRIQFELFFLTKLWYHSTRCTAQNPATMPHKKPTAQFWWRRFLFFVVDTFWASFTLQNKITQIWHNSWSSECFYLEGGHLRNIITRNWLWNQSGLEFWSILDDSVR